MRFLSVPPITWLCGLPTLCWWGPGLNAVLLVYLTHNIRKLNINFQCFRVNLLCLLMHLKMGGFERWQHINFDMQCEWHFTYEWHSFCSVISLKTWILLVLWAQRIGCFRPLSMLHSYRLLQSPCLLFSFKPFLVDHISYCSSHSSLSPLGRFQRIYTFLEIPP